MTDSEMNSGNDTRGKYAVIGAGPSGLAAAKNLRRQDIDCEVLESHSALGGIWNRSNPRSSVYSTTHTITSKNVTAYLDFPLADELPHYPRHDQIHSYLESFATAHELTDIIRFDQDVIGLSPDDEGGWRIETSDGAVRHYRGVVIANGHNWSPRYPDYPGDFAGDVMHARDYDNPSVFDGKRVLVVGAGNSGCDIAVDAARHAESVLISMRRGYYFVPKFVFGRPVDQVGQSTQSTRLPISLVRLGYRALLRIAFGSPTDYGLPAPDHRLLETPPIVNSLLPYYVAHGRVAPRPDIAQLDGDKVEFVDGRIDAVDVIVYATGYRFEVPFVDTKHLGWRDDGPDLFMMAMSRQHDNLFVAGLTDGTGGHFPTVDLQTQVIAKFVAGLDNGTEAAQRLAQRKTIDRPDSAGGIRFIDSPRSLTQFELNTYVRQLGRLLAELDREPVSDLRGDRLAVSNGASRLRRRRPGALSPQHVSPSKGPS